MWKVMQLQQHNIAAYWIYCSLLNVHIKVDGDGFELTLKLLVMVLIVFFHLWVTIVVIQRLRSKIALERTRKEFFVVYNEKFYVFALVASNIPKFYWIWVDLEYF